MKSPIMLIILDGYGIGEESKHNAAFLAETPVLNGLMKDCSHSEIIASGEEVGLPKGQMGNSEVGHLNIGAGRIIYQDLSRISKSIEEGQFFLNKKIIKIMKEVAQSDKSLHLMGLLSDGGVHSHRDHLYALLKMAKENGLNKVYIHAIMDGRDVSPNAGLEEMKMLEEKSNELGVGKVATVSGRYYAMDRDKRWDRTELAYNAYTLGKGELSYSAVEAIEKSYEKNIYDEFILPTVIYEGNKPVTTIEQGDGVIFFNFRPDRARQIVRALVDENFTGFNREKLFRGPLLCMTQYDSTIPNVSIAFEETVPENTLGEYIANKGLWQLRIAETEKYAHVTFFFNGGREVPFNKEDRALIPSPKVSTYDLQPEMSADEVGAETIRRIESGKYDLIVLNFANCDMVGHTGIISAAIKAVQTVDKNLGLILESLKKVGGVALITADHGNCEEMAKDDGQVITSHTTNKVPLILFNSKHKLKNGILADLAPTILDLLNLDKPVEMTGTSLINGGKNEFNK